MKKLITKRRKFAYHAAVYAIVCFTLIFTCNSCSNNSLPAMFSYANMNADYTLIITEDSSDRNVKLNVSRRDGVTEASIIYPESISNVRILHDESGTRIISEDSDIPLSGEASLGVSVLFDALAFNDSLSASINESSENGGISAKFFIGESEINLMLDNGGLPKTLDISLNGTSRRCDIENFNIIE